MRDPCFKEKEEEESEYTVATAIFKSLKLTCYCNCKTCVYHYRYDLLTYFLFSSISSVLVSGVCEYCFYFRGIDAGEVNLLLISVLLVQTDFFSDGQGVVKHWFFNIFGLVYDFYGYIILNLSFPSLILSLRFKKFFCLENLTDFLHTEFLCFDYIFLFLF